MVKTARRIFKGSILLTKIHVNYFDLQYHSLLIWRALRLTCCTLCGLQSAVTTTATVGDGLLSWRWYQWSKSKWWRKRHCSDLLIQRANCSVVDSNTAGGTESIMVWLIYIHVSTFSIYSIFSYWCRHLYWWDLNRPYFSCLRLQLKQLWVNYFCCASCMWVSHSKYMLLGRNQEVLPGWSRR